LKKPELRQLNQRISSRGVLKPLTIGQGIMYVECKLSAQGSKCSTIFEPRALNHLLRRSDGIPRKINMICHNAMLASFHAMERKVSFGTAKKVAAEYHDVVDITHRRSGMRFLVMPALIVGAALASLLLLGIAYPNVWSDWVLHHTGSFGAASEQAVRPVQTARHVKTVKHLKTAKQPAELQASLAAGAATPAASKSDVAAPATAPAAPIVPTAPAARALSAGTQKQIGVPAPEQRSQIIVRYGDTLEKIAIRYFGSTSGIKELIKANPQLTDINQLTVGQILYLPPGITPKAAHD
jgi:phage tail protein X